MIKLTNMADGYLGMPVYIAVDKIVSVFEASDDGEGSLSTVIMTGHDQLWVVEEGLSEVIKLIREVKNA